MHANASTSSVASPKKPVDPSIAPVRKVRNVSKSRPWSRPALTGPVAGNRLLAIRDRLISRQRSSNPWWPFNDDCSSSLNRMNVRNSTGDVMWAVC